jgi:hypothetical protein
MIFISRPYDIEFCAQNILKVSSDSSSEEIYTNNRIEYTVILWSVPLKFTQQNIRGTVITQVNTPARLREVKTSGGIRSIPVQKIAAGLASTVLLDIGPRRNP